MKNGNKQITEILAKGLKEKRRRFNLSLRDVQIATGVHRSTLCRIEHLQGIPDSDVICAVADYLGISVEHVLNKDLKDAPVAYLPGAEIPDIVDAHLVRDKNLSPEDAAKLGEIFRVAYRQFSGFEKK